MASVSSNSNETSAERIYQALRSDITTAALRPGERLVHRHLARQFGTSNIPVLEALRRLESDGLIVSYPNAGAQVRVWTEQDIEGAFLAREALEGVTGRLFAMHASATEKAKLREYGRRFDEAAAECDFSRGPKLDIQLHLHIARGGQSAPNASSTLFRIVENSHLLSATIINAFASLDAVREFSGPVGAHDALIEALCSGDPDRAEEAAKDHVRFAREDAMRLWLKQELTDL